MSLWCSAGSELIVLSADGSVGRCRGCVASGERYLEGGPCPIEEACRTKYPGDMADTRRIARSKAPSSTKVIVDPRVNILVFSEFLSSRSDRALIVSVRSDRGDAVAADNCGDVVEVAAAAGARVELRTTMSGVDTRYLAILKKLNRSKASVVTEVRTYEPGFDWNKVFGRTVMTARRNFQTSVVVPAHPAQIASAASIIERFAAAGVEVVVEPHPSYVGLAKVDELVAGLKNRKTRSGFEAL